LDAEKGVKHRGRHTTAELRRLMEKQKGARVSAGVGLLLRAGASLRAHGVWTASLRVRAYDDLALQWAAAGPQSCDCGSCCDDCDLVLQVAVAIRRAEGCTVLSAAAVRADYGAVLELLAAVLRVSGSASAGWWLA
jgi:hypothetical protein